MDDDLLRDLDDLDDALTGESGEEDAQLDDAQGDTLDAVEGDEAASEMTSMERLLASVSAAKDVASVARLSASHKYQDTLQVLPRPYNHIHADTH